MTRETTTRALGLDFGTTNTVLATCDSGGTANPVAFDFEARRMEALRSALCFWKAGAGAISVEAGPWAITQYIDHPDECRFMQSMKTFAASPHFDGTYVFAKRYRFEDLLDVFFTRTRAHAGAALDHLPKRLVMGRPVTFAGTGPDAALATARYRSALARFGFEEILFVYEPVAAAFFFARTLRKSATILVADFGGGTTDYSIMRFEVGSGMLRAKPLGHGGVGIAGDTFDYRIIDKVILPRLGKGSRYNSMGKTLDLPSGLFASFARWNLLSVLKTSSEFRDLKRMLKSCLEPDKLQRYIDFVDDDQGYPLYRAVSEAKARLSRADAADFSFAPLGRGSEVRLTREDFESWIAEDLRGMEIALDATLAKAGLAATAIDKVFLTGGTSFVPAVRRLFERRFGAERMESGDELMSIANGLALIGEREDAADWAVRADEHQA